MLQQTRYGVLGAALLIAAFTAVQGQQAALSQEPQAPAFMQKTLPENAVAPAFEEFQAVTGDGALDRKTKELIGLAVAAQIPCDYCVYYHATAAEALGATEEEIKEALATAALVRHWSTLLNGSQYDMDEWRNEVDAMFENEDS